MKKTKSILAVAIMDLYMSILPCSTVSGSTFSERINELGLDRIRRDWSNDTYITIEEPSCAYVNITGATRVPEYKGDITTSITIGDWVEQDGFHFKAYYSDFFRGIAVMGCKLYQQMTDDIGRAWSRSGGLAKNEPKALCHPDGFPCVVYLNGNFYGIYSWQLKKYRANMAQRKGDARQEGEDTATRTLVHQEREEVH